LTQRDPLGFALGSSERRQEHAEMAYGDETSSSMSVNADFCWRIFHNVTLVCCFFISGTRADSKQILPSVNPDYYLL